MSNQPVSNTKGLILSPAQVNKIREGIKSQVRVPFKKAPVLEEAFVGGRKGHYWTFDDVATPEGWVLHNLCPMGRVGSFIHVRENWMDLRGTGVEHSSGRFAYQANDMPGSYGDARRLDEGLKWRPSSTMRRSAARFALEITGVKAEKLKSMSTEDAIADSGLYFDDDTGMWALTPEELVEDSANAHPILLAKREYEARGFDWNADNWVWVLDIKLHEIKALRESGFWKD